MQSGIEKLQRLLADSDMAAGQQLRDMESLFEPGQLAPQRMELGRAIDMLQFANAELILADIISRLNIELNNG